MSHAVAALNSPNILLPSAQSRMTQAMASATGSKASGSSSSASGTTNLGNTFLNLLSTELQNQDPTAPVDATAMVGQMISLNQLDQLIAINQTLGATPTASVVSTKPMGAAVHATPPPAPDPASMVSNAQTTLPFDPNTMMPIANVPASSTSINGAH